MYKQYVALALLFTFVAGASPALANNTTGGEMGEKMREKNENREKISQEIREIRQDFQDGKKKIQEKAYLSGVIDAMIKKMEETKVLIQNRVHISESDKKEALAQIEKELAWLAAEKVKLEAATPENVKSIAKEIREHSEFAQRKAKRMAGNIVEKGVERSFEKINSTMVKTEAEIAALKLQGKNVTVYEARVADIKIKIAAAQTKFTEAKSIYAGIELKDNVADSLKNMRALLEEGSKNLHKVSQLLKHVVEDLRIEFDLKLNTGV